MAAGLVRRRRLVAVVVVVALVAGVAGGGAWWWYRTADPIAGELEALAFDPQAALEWLAPEGGGSSGGAAGENNSGEGWVPSSAALERWEQLSSRRWGARGVDALAGVVAAVAPWRAAEGEDAEGVEEGVGGGTESGVLGARAQRVSWVVAQAVGVLADHSGLLGRDGQRAVGVVLGQCGQELQRRASGGTTTTISDNEVYKDVAPLVVAGQEGRAGQDATGLSADLEALVRVAAGDREAVLAVGQGTTGYAAARAGAMADANGGDAAAKQDDISLAFGDQQQLVEWVDGIAVEEGGLDPSESAVGRDELSAAALGVVIEKGLIDDTQLEDYPWYNSEDRSISLDTPEQQDRFRAWLDGLSPGNSSLSKGLVDTMKNES